MINRHIVAKLAGVLVTLATMWSCGDHDRELPVDEIKELARQAMDARDPKSSQEALDALLRLTGDVNRLNRTNALATLGRIVAGIDSPEVRGEIIALMVAKLRDKDVFTQRAAIIAIGESGERSQAAIDELAAIVISTHPHLAVPAARSLGAMGDSARGVSNKILNVIDISLQMGNEEGAQLGEAAAESLAKIGGVLPGDVARLLELIARTPDRVRVHLIYVACRDKPSDSTRMALLGDAILHGQPFIRRRAIYYAESLDEYAIALLPVLRECLNDADDSVRRSAKHAIDSIEADHPSSENSP